MSKSVRSGYKHFDSQVACECGAPAVRQVWFWQLTGEGKRRVCTSLPVCEQCYALAKEDQVADTRRELVGHD